MEKWLVLVLVAFGYNNAQFTVRHPEADYIIIEQTKEWKLVPTCCWTGSWEGRKIWHKFISRSGSFVFAMSYDNKKWSVPPHQSWHDRSGNLLRISHDKRVESSANGGANWTNLKDRSWIAEDGFRYKCDEKGKLWKRPG
ncbi:MAG TPA: hypothetical protein VI731_01325 [Bacteroidia bacterium]|nr:hypothetical protein [Bacteroidia bacterium]